MKYFICLLMVSTLMLEACTNNKSKGTDNITIRDEKETNDPKQKALLDIEKQKEALLQVLPLPAEQLKALLPGTLMGAEKKNDEINASIGANVASADYEINDSTSIALSVYDCAGPGGSGIYGMHFAGLLNDLHENDQDYTKSVDFNGGKAFEQCDKINFECTFSFFTGGRFLVTLQGDHVNAVELKQVASGLKIK
jgi:hypothetical protein